MREVLEVNPAVLERYFRARERELEPRVSPPYVVRMDGVGFGRALADLPGPRDRRVHTALVEAAARLVRTYGACGAFVISDEVSVFFDTSNPYGGRVEKLSSVLASMLASLVSLSLGPVSYTHLTLPTTERV